MRLLGLITARGGSKRIPGKNLRNVGGKTLVAWTIEEDGGAISYSETTIALLQEYGIHYCLSVEHRDVSTKDMASPFALPRYDCTCFPY
ncbi:hypothetical protein [Thermodesulfomicrobium sp. WS]|uniref:cytidylyltransferase domain-containing protein n=1 Tax=Thermodesulfomicrobium sp. WS TaxID=3004129 RepID=UPI002493B363|nr:hypothetical protein [Thermodesulfomicrobium sp. WS]